METRITCTSGQEWINTNVQNQSLMRNKESSGSDSVWGFQCMSWLQKNDEVVGKCGENVINDSRQILIEF